MPCSNVNDSFLPPPPPINAPSNVQYSFKSIDFRNENKLYYVRTFDYETKGH